MQWLHILIIFHAAIVVVQGSYGEWTGWSGCYVPNIFGLAKRRRGRTCTTATCTGPDTAFDLGNCLAGGTSFSRYTYPPSDTAISSYGDFRSKMRLNYQYYYNVQIKFVAIVGENSHGYPDGRMFTNGLTVTPNAFNELGGLSVVHDMGGVTMFFKNYEPRSNGGALEEFDYGVRVYPTETSSTTFQVSSIWTFDLQNAEDFTIFIVQNIAAKLNPASPAFVSLDEKSNHLSFPGITERHDFELGLTGAPVGFAEIRVFTPTTIALAGVRDAFYPPLKKWSVTVYPEKNAKVFNLGKYLPSSISGYDLKTSVEMVANSLTNSADSYALIIESTYCMSEQTCANYEFVHTRKQKQLMSADKYMFNWPELGMRMKNPQTGLCFTLVESDSQLGLSSKCHQTYRLGDSGHLTYTATNQVLHQNTARPDGDRWMRFHPPGTKREIFYYTSSNSFIQRYQRGSVGCVSAKTDLYVGVEGEQQPPITCDQPEHIFMALPGYSDDVMAKVAMKSIHYTTTGLGSTLVVCQPAGDLVSKTNCRYTLDNGATWKGITPYITSLKFYLSSQSLYYGYCNGAKYSCTYDIATGRILMITETDMITASGDLNKLAQVNLDDLPLTTTPFDSDYPSFGVSSLGIYTGSSGSWTSRFLLWSN